MIWQEVNELIHQGENACIEFKELPVRPEVIAREMVAFANSSGDAVPVTGASIQQLGKNVSVRELGEELRVTLSL